MHGYPKFEYFLPHKDSVKKESGLWTAPIPMNRNSFPGQPQSNGSICINYGDYFSAARTFLEKDRFDILKYAISQRINQDIEPSDIEKIQIHLEKHGEFYHPARVETAVQGSRFSFVLNVAVSDPGKVCIQREYNLLEKLNNVSKSSYLPGVYGQGKVSIKDNIQVRMFLGKWFEDFNEFHICFDRTDGRNKIAVWDPDKGSFFLTTHQTRQLYRQAAMILTCYYDPETFEQITLWHHAAGDFVVKQLNEILELRLITARGYASFIDEKDRDARSILEALLVFLLNLSIRMRLDRKDGVGDIVWADSIAVEETLSGFFQGLALKPPICLFGDPLPALFRKYLSAFSERYLLDLSRAVVDIYNPLSPDVPVVKRNLKKHIEVLHNAINEYVD